MQHSLSRSGFSLVELSIALVIIGLLVGGILGGRSLIHAAEIRSVISDYKQYKTAVDAFELQYGGWPGDIINATEYWGAADGADGYGNDCYDVDSTDSQATCNGNGNGRLLFTDNVADSSAPEWYRAWQQLANAGLVNGQFSGTAAAAPRAALPGVNVPESAMGGGYTLMSFEALASDPNWWEGSYDGVQLGEPDGAGETQQRLLTAPEAWTIDSKIDDGLPGKGLIRSRRWQTWCHTGTTPDTAVYQLNEESRIACPLMMSFSPPS